MSASPVKPLGSENTLSRLIPNETGRAQGVIALSSFLFAVLQSICTFFVALDGLRLLIGAGSLAISATTGAALDRFHANWIRIPMIGLALLGSLLNLAILMQLRRLRRRPASQWRQKPLGAHKIFMERMQLILSIATLVLIGIEEFQHFQHFHTL